MTPPTDSIKMSIDGLHLRFSSSLLSFLASRTARHRFSMGEWLLSLDDDMLAHLQQLAETATQDPKSTGHAAYAVEDMVSVVLHALAAERQAGKVAIREGDLGLHVGLLCMLATLERLRRRGLLSYEGVMSIELDAPNTIVLNPDALALEPEIRRQMMRGLH